VENTTTPVSITPSKSSVGPGQVGAGIDRADADHDRARRRGG
jgi:hypothetical protein